MRRYVNIIISLLFLSLYSHAAFIKPGIVRTIRQEYAPSKPIPNVKIYIQGRNVIASDANGAFSIILNAKEGSKFKIDSISCSGYEVENEKFFEQQYTYSNEPLVITLIDIKAYHNHLLGIKKSMRKKYETEIETIQDEIDKGKIALQEGRDKIAKLEEDLDQVSYIVNTIGRDIYRKDIGSFNEYDKAFNNALKNNNIQQCRKLRGNTEKAMEEHRKYMRNQYEYNEAEKQHKVVGKVLEEQKQGLEAEREDLFIKYKHAYKSFLTEHKYDSAKIYVDMIAELDTNNFDYQYEVGVFYNEFEEHQKALEYFKRLEKIIANDSKVSMQRAKTYQEIATTYSLLGNYSLAERYFKKSLDVYGRLGDARTNYLALAQCLNNYGRCLQKQNRYKADSYIENAYKYRLQYYAPADDIVESLINVASCYIVQYQNDGGDFRSGMTKKQEKLINTACTYLRQADERIADVGEGLISRTLEISLRYAYANVLYVRNEKDEAKRQFEKYYRLIEIKYGALDNETKKIRSELMKINML